MKIEDGDFRVRLTKKMLIKAFLELRRQKPLRKITVSELCSAAGVGRGTFYAHFTDIYDLNEKLEDKFLADFSAALRGALQEKAGTCFLRSCSPNRPMGLVMYIQFCSIA